MGEKGKRENEGGGGKTVVVEQWNWRKKGSFFSWVERSLAV